MDLHEANRLARQVLADCGLENWTFAFDRAVKRAGKCEFTARRITASRKLTALYTPEQFRYVILHEAAHALVGHAAGHGVIWQEKAIELGIKPLRNVPAEFPTLSLPWVGTCPNGHTVERVRAPKNLLTCKRCFPRFNRSYEFSWSKNGKVVRLEDMPHTYQAERIRGV